MGRLALIAVLAVCLSGSLTAAGVAGQQSAGVAPQPHSETDRRCPPRHELDAALGKASALMEQARYQDTAETLQLLSGMSCDARVSLLLAAAFEGAGDVPKAEQTLQRAHSVWPSNNSIAASLAREYLGGGQVDKAIQALGHFHVTAATPMQEMELGIVVFLAGHQLTSAQAVAEVAYKTYPSVHSLLMLANTLQLQGRFKDVLHLLGDRRGTYAQSPEFLITLAESEYDAILYDSARRDLESAISLDQKSYPAHLLLGNVFFKLGDVDQAVAEYRLAIRLAPDQPRTYYQLALALQTKQDEAGAERMLVQALAVDSHYAPARVEMGRILMGQNRLSEAVVQLNLAVQDNPAAEQAYFLLARAYAGLGEKEKSDEMAKRLVTVRNANWRSSENKDGSQPASDQATSP